jgi:hypothetical protein
VQVGEGAFVGAEVKVAVARGRSTGVVIVGSTRSGVATGAQEAGNTASMKINRVVINFIISPLALIPNIQAISPTNKFRSPPDDLLCFSIAHQRTLSVGQAVPPADLDCITLARVRFVRAYFLSMFKQDAVGREEILAVGRRSAGLWYEWHSDGYSLKVIFVQIV